MGGQAILFRIALHPEFLPSNQMNPLSEKQQADLLEALRDMLDERVWAVVPYAKWHLHCNNCGRPFEGAHTASCPVGKALRVYNEVVGK